MKDGPEKRTQNAEGKSKMERTAARWWLWRQTMGILLGDVFQRKREQVDKKKKMFTYTTPESLLKS